MKVTVKLFYFFLLGTVLPCCSLFQEEELLQTSTPLISPSDKSILESETVSFWWESMKGADHYEIQLARPSFNGIVQMVLDTILLQNSFKISLDSGAYEWRLRARNSSYVTQFSYYTFSVKTGLEVVDISGRTPNIIAPKDSLFVNSGEIFFWWEPIEGAAHYEFSLVTPTFDSIDRLVRLEEIINSNTKLSLDTGVYQWRVRSKNDQYASNWALRTLFVR